MVVLKVLAVFIMGTAVGIMYRIPRNLLLYASLVGLVAWLVMYGTLYAGGTLISASFLASVAVGLVGEMLARVLRKPASIFTIPGFIPLVPGRDAYTAMLYMVEGKYVDGISRGVQTLLVAGAIAFGLFVSSTIYRLVINYMLERKDHYVSKS